MTSVRRFEAGAKLANGLRIDSLLGSGASAEVWRATTSTGVEVALKIPRAGIAGAAQLVRREHRVLAGLSHPSLPTVLDVVTVGAMPVVVFPYFSGGDLVALLGAPYRHWLRAAQQLAEVLDYVHDSGWAHRDVKPRNVLITSNGNAQLVDFSLAAEIGSRSIGGGTPEYQHPARAEDRVTRSDDVFAYAVTLFELLEGRLPDGRGSSAFARSTRKEPAELVNLVKRTLRAKKNASPGSVRPFLDVLKSTVMD